MITKLATFRGVSLDGEPLVQLFRPEQGLTKIAGTLLPEIQAWLKTYKPKDDELCLLVNAMGASEYWGANINGDCFFEDSLIHDCRQHPSDQHPVDEFTKKVIPSYGHWTFLTAGVFHHHKNKDPTRAFGKVALSIWNPRMKRVELVVLVSRSAAMQHGAQDVVDKILAGEYPDCSMGTKVPFDVCLCCGAKSRTREDYCSCIKYIGMGKILDDGRRIAVANPYPRFFDISFVFIGADKTAKMMVKLASGSALPQSVVDASELYDLRAHCGAHECQECSGGCKVKAAFLNKEAFESQDYSFRDGKYYNSYGTNRRDIMEDWKARRGLTPQQAEGAPGYWYAEQEITDPEQIQAAHEYVTRPAYRPEWRSKGHPVSRTISGSIIGGVAGGLLGAATHKPALAIGGATAGAFAGGVLGHQLPKLIHPMPKVASLADSMYELRSSPGRYVSRRQLEELAQQSVRDNGDKDSEIRQLRLQKGLHPGEVMPPDPLEAGLLMGKMDNQLSPQGMRQDGLLRTNYSRAEEEKLSAPRGLLQIEERLAEIVGQPGVRDRFEKVIDIAQYIDPSVLTKKEKKDVLNIFAQLKAFNDLHGAKEKTSQDVLGPLFAAAKKIEIGPSPTPNRTKYPFIGSLNFRGLRVNIENKPGDVRSGTSKNGETWHTNMKIPYGEILGTRGYDGDKLDCYVGPDRNAPNVYIVHQNFVGGAKDGEYDEDKTMLGFKSVEEAKAAYLAHYTNPRYFRSITTMAFPLFKKTIFDSDTKGEKVAEQMHKVAMETHLEDLFANASTARRRERIWRDEVTGKEKKVIGSGLDSKQEPVEKKKEASVKAANHKEAAQSKWAEIIKRVGPSKAVGQVGPLLSKNEPDLPTEVLESMGHESDLSKSLATSSLMGMVLKPREFQHMALSHLGKDDLARQLEESNIQFAPSEGEVAPCAPLSPLQLSPEILEMLLPYLEEKSYLGPVVSRRVPKALAAKPKEAESPTTTDSPLLSKVSAAYNWYRREMLKVAAETPFVVPSLPELHARIYDLDIGDLFHKKAEVVGGRAAALILGSIPVSLMYAAHLSEVKNKGQDPGPIGEFFADHPWLSAIGVAAALREFLKTPKGQEVADKLFAGAKALKAGVQHGL